MSKNIISIDIGAGSARTFLSEFNGAKIKIMPMHRFSNNQILLGNTLYFDFFNMMSNIKEAIALCFKKTNENIDSIGVNSFGASFGLIDKEGDLMANPISYRDNHYLLGQQGVEKIISMEELDELNMSKTYPHCPLFLLYYLYAHKKDFARAINIFLPIANLVCFFLCGESGVDASSLSGSQFFNTAKRTYTTDILDKLNIDNSILPVIKEDYSRNAKLKKQYQVKSKIHPIAKISMVCSHDTASCTVGLPLKNRDAFIISGTWSVIGVERSGPIFVEDFKKTDFTYWNGYRDKLLFVKIYSGFYFFQELKKIMQTQKNQTIDDDDFFRTIPLQGSNTNLINLNSKILFDERSDMHERIIKFFKISGQDHIFEFEKISEAILKSIVLEYRIALKELEAACGFKVEKIYITGGGSKNTVFCSWLSSAISKEIIAGYTESAIQGNLICQLINSHEISNIYEARELLKDSFKEIKYHYLEHTHIDWDHLEEKYLKLKEY